MEPLTDTTLREKICASKQLQKSPLTKKKKKNSTQNDNSLKFFASF